LATKTFDSDRVERGIAGTRFAGYLLHFSTVPSTNTFALEAAQSGLPTGVWIADEQTAGRGRGGHVWHSAAGSAQEPVGLYLSVLVRPKVTLNRALWLSLGTGLAVKRAVAEVAGVVVDIRWPNDLLLGRKKCGGILVETASDAGAPGKPPALRHAVIGIGINLNHREFPKELEVIATSIALESGVVQAREPLVIALLKALDEEIALLESPDAADILTRFTEASNWVEGKRVRLESRADTPDGYTGTTAGLDANGFLLVEGDDGKLRTVISGGVREL
jgi:BirA family transcriptional regulator, biotin operon repressor / biotin---[acetyl-CoA-carboxylase] ligase